MYGVAPSGERFVVTIDGTATMAPRWPAYEEARRDAWERHWSDERGAKLLAEYEAQRGK